VFAVVVYAEDIRVNIPIALSVGRGAGGHYPVKLLYLNVIPVIFATALFANIQLWAFLAKDTPLAPLLGVYNEVSTQEGTKYELVGGLAYFLSPPSLLKDISLVLSGNPPTSLLPDFIRAAVYIALLTLASIFFGLLWVEVAGFGPREIARQLATSGFGIPGFRRDPRVIERVLEKYIPPTAFLGSLFVGLLAGLTGVFLSANNISGTGILLAVQIVNRYHELLSREKLFDAYPILKKVFG
jgi:preprotein translocase subunit SecY